MKKFFKYFMMAVRGDEDNFTSGSVNRALFLLSIPMILEMSMEALFAIVDVFFISQLHDDNAIATIGLTETFMFIVMSLALGVSSAATALVSRRIGENKPKEASTAGAQSIIISLILSVILGYFGIFHADDLLRLIGADEALIATGVGYTQIILGLNFILILLFVNNAIFRGAGNASIAMRSLWLANGINIFLDPCLIFGFWFFPELGLEGAAIATCTGRGVGILYQLWHMFDGKAIIKLGLDEFKIRWDIIAQLLKIASGGAGQHLLTSTSWIFMISIIAQFGSEALAGYTIAMRIIMFTLLPSWGMAMAASTLVGQNLGANQPERAEKSAWKAAVYNMYFLIFLSVIFLFFARPFIEIFSTTQEVIDYGTLALQIITAGYIFYAYEMVLGQAFNGAGDTFTPTLLNFIAFWVIQVPMAYCLSIPLAFGPTGIFLAMAISSGILAVMIIIQFRKGNWKKVVV